MVQLKKASGVKVQRLVWDDDLAARVLRQPPGDIQDHEVHEDPALPGSVGLLDLLKGIFPDASLEVAQSAAAHLLQRPAAEGGGGGEEAVEVVDVDVVVLGAAEGLSLQEEEHPVERQAVHLHRDLRSSVTLVLHGLGQRDARPQQLLLHREPLLVGGCDVHQVPGVFAPLRPGGHVCEHQPAVQARSGLEV
eukprot:CAMPEP_0118931220 /NCGR_PEP_ID=MMETSP1169-20130426/7634_1 /TAXON_ID=36882 /ORGANISM="Pyramimonas obovata, Strain CCMP722" /LENGTH=191 /DNA_ID=CAMNT_0006873695 /DNA_START=151 /DNA_END=726 /DNA_ORIENTATION=+